jgi:xanthine dehydrogenase YagR molybdenum-binding subunit
MPWPTTRRVIGRKHQRLDGPDKSTGRAKYSFDINRPGMLHARILRCPHARARVRSVNTQAAQQLPGFRALWRIPEAADNNILYFAGAEVIAVCADTEGHAEDILRAITVDYEVMPHFVREQDVLQAGAQASTAPGTNGANIRPGGDFVTENFERDAYPGLSGAPTSGGPIVAQVAALVGTAQNVVVAQNTYGVPVIAHQCLESHGLVAEWRRENNQDYLTVWCSTQAVPQTAANLAQHFNIPAARVKCITHFMGGGFGSKFGPDIQGIACAELAKLANAPVKLMLDRAEEVVVGGNRPSAFGTVKMACNAQGQFRTYEVDCYGSSGTGNAATVNLQYLPYVYAPSIPFIKRNHRVVRLNTSPARAMRAPGHPQNCVLTEWIIDELAARIGMDPLQMRLRNLPANEAAAVANDPLSFNAMRYMVYSQEIALARKLSDWDKKWHPPGQGTGVIKRGIGMAVHTWGGAGRQDNDHTVQVHRDGSVLVRASTQDLGTAQRTVEAIIAAEVFGLDPKQITVELGESQYGRSTGSGGSTTCPGTAPAVYLAATAARTNFLQALAGSLNVPVANLTIQRAPNSQWPDVVNTANQQRWNWRQACARLGENPVTGQGNWEAGYSNNGVGGVQVAEVEVDTETGVVKCTRVVAVQDCGMIINKLGCESQVAGGVIMGLNYALFEERVMDRVTGRQCNPDMEFYKLAGIQDIPNIIVQMYDMPERGVIGIGEPPTISTCAAIGNALYNALGVRVRQAPFTPERVLAALS